MHTVAILAVKPVLEGLLLTVLFEEDGCLLVSTPRICKDEQVVCVLLSDFGRAQHFGPHCRERGAGALTVHPMEGGVGRIESVFGCIGGHVGYSIS